MGQNACPLNLTHIGMQKSMFLGCDVGALQRDLSLVDACAVCMPRAQSDSSYPDQAERAETRRTWLPHLAHQPKRWFEAALGLALHVA